MPNWVEVIVRSFVLLVALFLITKRLGKRQITQLSVFDYITGIVLGGIVAMHSYDTNLNLLYGLLAMAVWFLVPLFIEYLSLKSKAIRDYIDGKGTVLIKDGKVLEDNLKKEKFTTDDLLQELRSKDVFKVADVEFAILEPSGTLSVLPKKEVQPITPKTLGINVPREKEPETVIMDGEMIYKGLENMSLNPEWLHTELEKLNISLEEVFLAQVDQDGELSVDLFNDELQIDLPKEKQLLLAELRKCQADLELFALQSFNSQSKEIYNTNSKKLKQLISKLKPFLDN